MAFYASEGFVQQAEEKGYYKHVEPADAYRLVKTFTA